VSGWAIPAKTKPPTTASTSASMKQLLTIGIPRGSLRLYLVCLHLVLGASIWGYNIGILSSILVHPGWAAAINHPTPSQKGFITGIYYLGTFLSYLLLSHWLADRLGRRYAALLGTLGLCVGAVVMAAAGGHAAINVFVSGRLICGVGVGVVSTTVPLYQRLVMASIRGSAIGSVDDVDLSNSLL
jgi:MFS family permease